MTKFFTKLALVAGAMVALPGIAQAGTSTATGTVSMTVLNQCSVAGATVNLGTYSAGQTWGNISAALGSIDGMYNFQPGSLGSEYLNYGSVTCDAGTPYTLSIRGSHTSGEILIPHNGKTGRLLVALKKIGGTTIADTWTPGSGHVFSDDTVSGVGTGSAQTLLGSAIMFNLTNVIWNAPSDSDTLGAAGVATDTLTYTLNF